MNQAELDNFIKDYIQWSINAKAFFMQQPILDGAGGDFKGLDFRSCNLSHAVIRCCDFSSANLSNVRLSNTVLSHCNFTGANLGGSNLSLASAFKCDFTNAYLRNASLRSSRFRQSTFENTSLNGCSLNAASFTGSSFATSDLEEASIVSTLFETDGVSDDQIKYFQERILSKFKKNRRGNYIAYKTFGSLYPKPDSWRLKQRSIIEEKGLESNIYTNCGPGINLAPIDWVRERHEGLIWKVEILEGLTVPISSDGKIRCSKAKLIRIME